MHEPTPRIGRILGCWAAVVVFTWSAPAGAFFKEVRSPRHTAVNCVGKVSQLAAKLKTCATAANNTRLWCPNGQVFESAKQEGAPGALARSLCNMTQVMP
jgi:hypothetical protein